MKKLNYLIDQLAIYFPDANRFDLRISGSNIGWHIDHSLLVINQIIQAVLLSDPKEYEWKFNAKRFVVFTLNKIPRGKAKAPKAVMPLDDFDEDIIRLKFIKAKENIELLKQLPSNKFFVHPLFGKLNVKQTIKMIKLHTNHHLHIIKDIIHSKNNQ